MQISRVAHIPAPRLRILPLTPWPMHLGERRLPQVTSGSHFSTATIKLLDMSATTQMVTVPHFFNTLSGSVEATGSFCPVVGNPYLHGYFNFAESSVETVLNSLLLSCGSELTRQGISLP